METVVSEVPPQGYGIAFGLLQFRNGRFQEASAILILVTLQVLSSRMWLRTTMLASTAIEYSASQKVLYDNAGLEHPHLLTTSFFP